MKKPNHKHLFYGALLLSSLTFAQSNNQQQFRDGHKGPGLEILDISSIGLVDSAAYTNLVKQLDEKIKTHNQMIMDKFDINKDGKLDSTEIDSINKWIEERKNFNPSMSQQGDGGPNQEIPEGALNDNMGQGEMPQKGNTGMMAKGGSGKHPMGGMNNANASITPLANLEISKQQITLSDKTLIANKKNESVIRTKKNGSLVATNLVINKVSGATSSGDESNFYALNAAVAAESGTSIILKGGTITSDAEGSNAVFAFGKKAKIEVSDLKIHTKQNSSRGLDATYGGTVIGNNLSINTEGAHCADLATDRGEGTILAKHVEGTTQGEGSPGIYSTGNITAEDCKFEAFRSEAAVIEGKNSITVSNSKLIGHKSWGVMLYQSFSGDAGVGTSVFTMKNSELEAKEGPLFYSTNTNTKVTLENCVLTGYKGVLLRAEANKRWGRQGQNGAQVSFTATKQELKGSIEADNISTLDITFNENTNFNGAINYDNKAKRVKLTLKAGSKWNVTADSYITDLTLDEGIANIISNGHNIYYSSSQSKTLQNKTFKLNDGGYLKPM
jgi:hypothetical protein